MEYRTDRVTGVCKEDNLLAWVYFVRPGDEAILNGELECSSLEEAFRFAQSLLWEGMSARLVSPVTGQVFGEVHHAE